jgi:hypothetical protein
VIGRDRQTVYSARQSSFRRRIVEDESGRPGPEQLAEGGLEVARGEALEIEPREQALGLVGQVPPAGQDRAPEGRDVRGGVGHPGWADLDRPGADTDLALAGIAVAVAGKVVVGTVVAAAAEIGVDLGVEGPLEGELLKRLADGDLARRHEWLRSVGRLDAWRVVGRRCREGDRGGGVVRFSHGVSFWGFNNTGRVRRLFVPSTGTPRGTSPTG